MKLYFFVNLSQMLKSKFLVKFNKTKQIKKKQKQTNRNKENKQNKQTNKPKQNKSQKQNKTKQKQRYFVMTKWHLCQSGVGLPNTSSIFYFQTCKGAFRLHYETSAVTVHHNNFPRW